MKNFKLNINNLLLVTNQILHINKKTKIKYNKENNYKENNYIK
jgi:hypothetical protein